MNDLYLYGNKIKDVYPLKAVINLMNLELSNNEIINIKGLGKLINLKTLSLDNNKINSLKGLGSAINLESIRIAYNEISTIEDLSLLNKLNSLNLGNNKIVDVKPLNSIYKLKSVDISDNKINDISSLRELPELTLTNIEFSGNPLPKYVFMDKLNEKFILSTLSPYIESAIKQYYGGYRLYMNEGILSIQQVDGDYKLKIRVVTFVGPHNPPYGIETITITQDNSGIKVEDFKHEDEK